MKRYALVLGAALLMAAPALANQATQPAAGATAEATVDLATVTSAQQFAELAASSDMFEIQSSQLALTAAASAEAKDFAQHMVTDHTQSSAALMTAATAQGVTPPATMNPRHQQALDQLATLQGEQFDQAYLSAQLVAHQEAVTLFEAYSTNGEQGPLKDFAASTLPVLQQHLERVTQMAGGQPAAQ